MRLVNKGMAKESRPTSNKRITEVNPTPERTTEAKLTKETEEEINRRKVNGKSNSKPTRI